MKHKAQMYFWITATLIILAGGIKQLIAGDTTLDINVHDTYYVVDHWYAILLLALIYYLLGVFYWVLYQAEVPLNKKLTKVHTVSTVMAVPAYYILLWYCSYIIGDAVDNLTGKSTEVLNRGMLILVLAVALMQVLFVLNIIIGLLKPKKA